MSGYTPKVSCPYQTGQLDLQQCVNCKKLDVHIGDRVSPNCRAQETKKKKEYFKAAYLAAFYCGGRVQYDVEVEEAQDHD